ncbi:phenylalanine--tRNA ligase subunit beta [Phototrophicus methaneseepsis]|uniref:Phenylalanine--tRNA ligase beta subunit n=1 Tax=Phototrophicus methaneseepsis TaxID=2710758 RepID=A0A7S8E860_9CHLR|nr:phenylalanine--tRNA ligase subunit beta [Phototrophicus methaneseepsis]QPC82146.1 phenylalanine--tRNA ligase subunit beta [Phototrophicus methaneseepsis]
MLVPISWLKDYVDIDIPVELLAERLTLAGLEVAHIRYIGVPQQQVEGVRWPPSEHLVWDRDKLLLGAIKEVKSHPDADKLVLAMVDYGDSELEQCVTGAPNLFAYRDAGPLEKPLWTAFAKEGAVVWDGHSDEPKLMTLKGKKLRGVYNKSMVCSEKELGITDEHEGIILLDHNDAYVPGTPLQDVLGDVVMDIELTPNLGHCFSIMGVAREVAALLDVEIRNPSYEMDAEGPAIEGQVAVEIQEPSLNPRFTLTLLKGTEVKASPSWLKHRLRLVGQRPINNIVDVTNYITFELGQPLHAFDYDKLVERAGGKTPTIITRTPKEGEVLETLDGAKRKLSDEQILVTDTAGVLSLGGIMGGAETEISAETTNVLLEAANWDFISIRRTQQAHKLFTEAGTRFSRNVHPSRSILGVTRGIELMRQTGGGTIAEGVIDEYPQKAAPVEVTLPIADVQRLLGVEISVHQAADVLSRLQFEVTIDGDQIQAIAPDYRTDIGTGDVGVADLVEEIARIIGYDHIPDTIMADEMPPQLRNIKLNGEDLIRDLLVALGLRENISYRLTTPEAEAVLVPAGSKSSLPQADYVRIINPIAADKTHLRHTLLTNMLYNAANNGRYNERQQVFEIGAVYLKQKGKKLPDEPMHLGLLMTGPRGINGWMGNNSAEMVDFFDIKGVVEGLVNGLHIDDVSYERSQHTTFHPGRSAKLMVNGKDAGTFGQLHPIVAEQLRLSGPEIYIAEFDLDVLIDAIPARHEIVSLAVTPAIKEDIALVVPLDTPAADVAAVIQKAGGDVLKAVELFDVYVGDSIEAGHKSLAYALTYQTNDKTLKDKDVAKLRQRIIKSAEHQLGAKLRT